MITDPLADKYDNRFRYFTPQEISYSEETNGFGIDENSDGKSDYQFGNPDFNFRQFRSNLVVRWEYLPGSTLYLVWSQGRTSSATDGVFAYRTDMKELFGTTPVNVFLVKFSYWFQL